MFQNFGKIKYKVKDNISIASASETTSKYLKNVEFLKKSASHVIKPLYFTANVACKRIFKTCCVFDENKACGHLAWSQNLEKALCF